MLQFAIMLKRISPSLTLVLLITLGSIVIVLTVVTGYLYQQNKNYKTQIRELIIQNDSIMSVNIKLTDALKLKSGSKDYPSLSFKSRSN